MKIDKQAFVESAGTYTLCPDGGVAVIGPTEGFDKLLAFCKDDSEKSSFDNIKWDWVHSSIRKTEKKSKKSKKSE